jgi:hypothetical protein
MGRRIRANPTDHFEQLESFELQHTATILGIVIDAEKSTVGQQFNIFTRKRTLLSEGVILKL